MKHDYDIKGRFAPSPSGRMHLGNLFTALMSWLSVRSRGGKWLLRIEDLDPQRSRPEFARLIEDDLHWLGLDWDEGGLDDIGPNPPYSQSRRADRYAEALQRLVDAGKTFPCYCTRAEIMATQAPHQSDGRIVYPGTCRHITSAPPRRPSTRLIVSDEEIAYIDLVAGPQQFNLARECGDFILQRADGAWAYQLAVVVDDAEMGVTEVMRGNDLLLSAAQQIWLFRQLSLTPPEYAHLPLICNSAGQRLSKRDDSLSAEALRRRFSPHALTGLMAYMARLIPAPEPIAPARLIPFFSFDRLRQLPRHIVVSDDLSAHGGIF
ncbi:MAG: tRNA glutamyl-Q(34) synthetase GluQRS [Muribaculaceae bacterium]|nr:tRNA glutamyl-Q(34) synthetase GluQRS [Muribaculaceae bacterium]MDE7081016.1 tRNA glutamyl-Q(34) synthetase GluQRS [Muribaculaceae bacterium]